MASDPVRFFFSVYHNIIVIVTLLICWWSIIVTVRYCIGTEHCYSSLVYSSLV
jgi:hypothetical protein